MMTTTSLQQGQEHQLEDGNKVIATRATKPSRIKGNNAIAMRATMPSQIKGNNATVTRTMMSAQQWQQRHCH
jgi:hypothetical protein